MFLFPSTIIRISFNSFELKPEDFTNSTTPKLNLAVLPVLSTCMCAERCSLL